MAASQPAGIEEEYTSNWLNQYANLFSDTSPATGQGFRYDADGNLTEMFIAGDMNCDSSFDNSDISAFVDALVDPEEYATNYPGCDILRADINQDGDVNNSDIDGFVGLLLGAPTNKPM